MFDLKNDPIEENDLAARHPEHHAREQAIGRVLVALKAFTIVGVDTNIPLLRGILEDGEFLAGQVDTGFLARFMARSGWSGAAEKQQKKLWQESKTSPPNIPQRRLNRHQQSENTRCR